MSIKCVIAVIIFAASLFGCSTTLYVSGSLEMMDDRVRGESPMARFELGVAHPLGVEGYLFHRSIATNGFDYTPEESVNGAGARVRYDFD